MYHGPSGIGQSRSTLATNRHISCSLCRQRIRSGRAIRIPVVPGVRTRVRSCLRLIGNGFPLDLPRILAYIIELLSPFRIRSHSPNYVKDPLFDEFAPPVIQPHGPPQILQMLEGRVMKQGVDSGAAGLQGADVHIKLDLTLHHRKPVEGKEPTWKK